MPFEYIKPTVVVNSSSHSKKRSKKTSVPNSSSSPLVLPISITVKISFRWRFNKFEYHSNRIQLDKTLKNFLPFTIIWRLIWFLCHQNIIFIYVHWSFFALPSKRSYNVDTWPWISFCIAPILAYLCSFIWQKVGHTSQ